MKTKQKLLLFGILAGIINIIGWTIIDVAIGDDPADFSQGEVIGYVAMILSFSMVFFGIQNYRDKVKGGIISFKDAFLNGLIIVLVASIIYMIGWEVYYPTIADDFSALYEANMEQQWKEANLSEAEQAEQRASFDQWMENYSNPLIRMGITFAEIFPVGLIISLFVALILKRKG